MRQRRAFTLIELLIVVIVLGILVAIALPMLQGYIIKGRLGKAYAVVSTIESAEKAYYAEHGTYFTTGPDDKLLEGWIGMGAVSTQTFYNTLGVQLPSQANEFFHFSVVYCPTYSLFAGTTVIFVRVNYNIAVKYGMAEQPIFGKVLETGRWWVNPNSIQKPITKYVIPK